jgi:hypothetical protein
VGQRRGATNGVGGTLLPITIASQQLVAHEREDDWSKDACSKAGA